MPRPTGISSIAYTGIPGTKSADLRLSRERFAENGRQVIATRVGTNPFELLFSESFDGGSRWSQVPNAKLPSSIFTTAAGNPFNHRLFASVNGNLIWAYQNTTSPTFGTLNTTAVFYFSYDNGITWESNAATIELGSRSGFSIIELDPNFGKMTVHHDGTDWFVSFPDLSEHWYISPGFITQIDASNALAMSTVLYDDELINDHLKTLLATPLGVDEYRSFTYLNSIPITPTFASGALFGRALTFLENTYAQLGFSNELRLQFSLDREGLEWGTWDFVTLGYTGITTNEVPGNFYSYHMFSRIDAVRADIGYSALVYEIRTGGSSIYQIGSRFDNSDLSGSGETAINLTFNNIPRFSADSRGKGVLILGDNRLYSAGTGQSTYNQLPLLSLLTTFSGPTYLVEYVGPQVRDNNFTSDSLFLSGSIRGWIVKPATVSGGPLVTWKRGDQGTSIPQSYLSVIVPQQPGSPSGVNMSLELEFNKPFNNNNYDAAVYGYRVTAIRGQSGGIEANINFTTDEIYDVNNAGVINPVGALTNAEFGTAITSCGLEQQYYAIGAPGWQNLQGTTDSGIVYIYNNDGTLFRTIENPNVFESGRFGDGLISYQNNIIIAAPDQNSTSGEVFMFDIETGNLIRSFSFEFGSRIGENGAILVLDSYLIIGCADNSEVYVYDINTGNLENTITKPSGIASLNFGTSISTFEFGQRLAVSAAALTNTDGRVYVYNSPLDTTPYATIINPGSSPLNYFGQSLASSGSDDLWVGAPYGDNDDGLRGTVYRYTYDFFTSQFVLRNTIRVSDLGLNEGSRFGERILSNDGVNLLITAPGGQGGWVYLYKLPSIYIEDNVLIYPEPILEYKFSNPNAFDTPESDRFGSAIAYYGNLGDAKSKLLIGAPLDQGGLTKTQAGTVYSYDPTDYILSSETINVDVNNPFQEVNVSGVVRQTPERAKLRLDVSISQGTELRIYKPTFKAGKPIVDTGFLTNVYPADVSFQSGAIAVQSDGKILVAVNSSLTGSASEKLRRLNSDGSTEDTVFNTGNISADDTINSITLQSDGKIIVGGAFTLFADAGAAGLSSRNRLVRLNADGTLDTAFATNTGTGFNGTVRAIALQSDGKIVVGGDFNSYDGVTQNYITRLNADGTRDTGFTIGTGFGPATNVIALQTDGKILVGGFFGSYNGTSQSCITRLNTDGTIDSTFATNIGTGFDGTVRAIIVVDSSIFVGGNFTQFNGQTRNRLAKLNSDGTLDSTFDPQIDFNVLTLETDINGNILAGLGGFSGINSNTRSNPQILFKRLDRFGGFDEGNQTLVFDPFTYDLSVDRHNEIKSIVRQSDGSLLVFSDNDVNDLRLVRLYR